MHQFEVKVTEEMIRHSRILDILYFSGFVYVVAVLFLVLALGISARARDAAARVTRQPFLLTMIYAALLTVITAIMEFPLSFYAGFMVPHQFNLSNENFAGWLSDEAKALAISIVITSVVATAALYGIRKFKRWWLVLSIGAAPFIIFMVIIAPVFIDPLFNDFQPLRDQVLKQRLLDMAQKARIEGSRVYEVNKSKQTKTLNAYVTGLGPTKRIVMWDTLLAAMTQDEVVAVMSHEMGHYVLHHVWKGTALTIAGTFFLLFVAQFAYERGIARWGARWRVRGPDDAAALPWLLLIVTVLTFFGEPISNGVSRYIEHEADVFGLQLTHLNEPMATAFIKLAETSKTNPSPNRFIEFWRYSHPSINRRIAFVLGYGARTSSPNRPPESDRHRAEAPSR